LDRHAARSAGGLASDDGAYREAGHAIAAWLRTDDPVETVTIAPGEPSIGALVREHLLDDDDIELALEHGHQDEIRRSRNHIEDAIFVSLAGPYAQRRHAPSSKWRRGKDHQQASRLIYALNQHCHKPAMVIRSS
jgi:ATP-dependent Zn protease